MKITASKLRENIYKILDQVLETGAPVDIPRSHAIRPAVDLGTDPLDADSDDDLLDDGLEVAAGVD
ncbi:MAG: hypothetical protein ACREQQ_09465, partial [Candidatus Binatia bacterium]